MLRTCTTSTETALLSLSSYKASAQIVTTSDDAILQTALDRATALIEGYVGYPLKRQVYEETVPSGGSNELAVSRVPLRSIESINISTETVDPTSYDIASEGGGLIYRELGWPWSAGIEYDLTARVVPGGTVRSYTVVYESGYCVNGSTADGWLTTGEPVPSEVEAAIALTATFIHRAAIRDPSVTSKRIGDLTISYLSGGGMVGQGSVASIGIPDTAKGLVAHLRRF